MSACETTASTGDPPDSPHTPTAGPAVPPEDTHLAESHDSPAQRAVAESPAPQPEEQQSPVPVTEQQERDLEKPQEDKAVVENEWDDSDDEDCGRTMEVSTNPEQVVWEGGVGDEEWIGGSSYSGGSMLRCVSCDARVSRWVERRWGPEVDNLLLRNHWADHDQLKLHLVPDSACASYSCRCSWQTVNTLKALTNLRAKAAPDGEDTCYSPLA